MISDHILSKMKVVMREEIASYYSVLAWTWTHAQSASRFCQVYLICFWQLNRFFIKYTTTHKIYSSYKLLRLQRTAEL